MRAMRSLPLLVPGAMLLAAATFAHAQTSEPPALQAMDVFQLQWADHPQLSPDGKTIVYERCWFDVMKDRKRSNLWIVGSDGRGNRPLTTGAAKNAHFDQGIAVFIQPRGGLMAELSVSGQQINYEPMNRTQTVRR